MIMKIKQDRTVYFHEDGLWVNQLNMDPWTATHHATKDDALLAAREMLKTEGGGELTQLSVDGVLEFKESVRA